MPNRMSITATTGGRLIRNGQEGAEFCGELSNLGGPVFFATTRDDAAWREVMSRSRVIARPGLVLNHWHQQGDRVIGSEGGVGQ